eukprot:TRINITY_DN10295_c0_g1_i1.p1 TRINITY_DN10295_c0_g1~~TRINITY_DN10295_c0_g1_i1.p1  ORF type:complete len:430 (-),score=-11.56 TRINITY_DN10295_c0_g1_i1:124-1413(-)
MQSFNVHFYHKSGLDALPNEILVMIMRFVRTIGRKLAFSSCGRRYRTLLLTVTDLGSYSIPPHLTCAFPNLEVIRIRGFCTCSRRRNYLSSLLGRYKGKVTRREYNWGELSISSRVRKLYCSENFKLGKLPHLTHFGGNLYRVIAPNLIAYSFTDMGCRRIETTPHLQKLRLGVYGIIDWDELARVPIRILEVPNWNIPAAALDKLTALQSLECCSLKGLDDFTHLRFTRLSMQNAHPRLPATLRELQISDDLNPTDTGRLTALTALNTRIGANLSGLRCEKIISLGLYRADYADEQLRRFTALQSFATDRTVTDETLRRFTDLRSLELYEPSSITDAGLRGLTNLTYLLMPPLATAKCLRNLTTLRELSCNESVECEDITHLTKLTAVHGLKMATIELCALDLVELSADEYEPSIEEIKRAMPFTDFQ